MFGPFLIDFGLIFDPFFIDLFHCISVTLLLNYMRSWRGGGDAALLRVVNLYIYIYRYGIDVEIAIIEAVM